jgi:uncharacterized protein YbjT (DUF2867 family)
MSKRSPVLVIGGSRSTGLHAARVLLRRGDPVRVLARDPAAAAKRLGSGAEVVKGDLTQPDTLPAALRNVRHIIFTAGVRSGRFVGERTVRATEYEGMLHTLEAARSEGFRGRFVYMTTIGVTQSSLLVTCLNLWKGNTVRWRRRAENALRECGLDYSVVRAAILLNRPPGTRPVRVSQQESRLTFREFIARADVAAGLVAAMDHPSGSRTTFEIRWDRQAETLPWCALLDHLKPDSTRGPRAV